jgi:myo-inositol 2-dehydrogenase/D-chiro-inositol 1-dehydrogenase
MPAVSSTDTHADLLEAVAEAGKAVLCGEPIDLDMARVDAAEAAVAAVSARARLAAGRDSAPASAPRRRARAR